jgi:WhiB family redox-sensing transcriptional regulator
VYDRPSNRDWRNDALCRDKDPELFFPAGTTGPINQRQIAKAKNICFDCPVRLDCKAEAFAAGEDAGVWGGMDEDERRYVKRRDSRRRQREQAKTDSRPITVVPEAVA